MRGNEFLQSDEDRLTAGKLIDAANMCYKRDIPVTTDFLDLNKQSVFHRINSSSEWPPVYYVMDGGYDTAERKMIIFCHMRISRIISPMILYESNRLIPVLRNHLHIGIISVHLWDLESRVIN